MAVLPKSLADLIEALGLLPGVGPRSAERFANFLLKNDAHKSKSLANALNKLHEGIDYCKKTYVLVEKGQEISKLYTDPSRDKQIVAVVSDHFDVLAIEKTSMFNGTYHVLGGLISPIEGIGPEDLHIPELIQRIKDDKVKEVVLATNASAEGESTALYINSQLDGLNIKITRLARGIPVGLDLEYADQITLGRALEGRTLL